MTWVRETTQTHKKEKVWKQKSEMDKHWKKNNTVEAARNSWFNFCYHFIPEIWQQYTWCGQPVVTHYWHKTKLTDAVSNVKDINQAGRTPLVLRRQQWLIPAEWLIDLVQTSSELTFFNGTLETNLKRQTRHTVCSPFLSCTCTWSTQSSNSLHSRRANEVFCLPLSWVNKPSQQNKAPCLFLSSFIKNHSPWVIPCLGMICLCFKRSSNLDLSFISNIILTNPMLCPL